MYGKAVGGDWMRIRQRNWLGAKFIFIKSDWNLLFMEGPYSDTGLIKMENIKERLFSNSSIASHAEMSVRVNPGGSRM
jgi:hypothetical protein